VERRSQKLMASMNGIDVSTFNRRLGQFSEPDGRWDDERRRRHSELMKARSGSPGETQNNSVSNGMENPSPTAGNGSEPPSVVPVPRKFHRQVRRLATFFNKSAGFGQAHLYSLHMKQELKPQIEKKGEDKTRNARLLAQAFGDQWFDAESRGVNNFKSVDGWIWHPLLLDVDKCECQAGQMGLPLAVSTNCSKCKGTGMIVYNHPLADYARVLLTFLILKGLRQYGSVEITQETIAEALGMDVNTVAKYEDKLEALMIIRCVAGAVTRDAAGAVVDRKPHKIIWLPDRLLDEDIAQREWQRFQALRSKLADTQGFRLAESLHVALLKAWRGKEHSLGAFWNELRRQFAAVGLSKGVSDALLPNYRE